jgi:hypothetical protein
VKKEQYQSYISKFKRKYPIFAKYSVKDIVSFTQKKQINGLETSNNLDYIKYHDDRIYNIWLSFLVSVPLHLQSVVSGFYNEYIRDRNNLIDFIVGMMTQIEDYEVLIIDQRDPTKKSPLQRVTQEAERQTILTLRDTNIEVDKSSDVYKKILAGKVKSLVRREYGQTFYRMVRQMQKYWKNK